ncbi:MAG: hypothetical protein FWH51_05560 [Dehalococcoidia bacterium]|nr:hypothetical protein [Dehalococcoidia bacterium]
MANIRIAAAASLINGLPEVIAEYQSNSLYSGNTIVWVAYGGSYALAREILGVAPDDSVANPTNPSYVTPPLPADILLTASTDAMDVVNNPGNHNHHNPNSVTLLSGPTNFIGNTLVLIQNSAASSLGITGFGDAYTKIGSGHIWVAEPDDAPAGEYAEDAFNAVPGGTPWATVYSKAQSDNTIGSDVQVALNGFLLDSQSVSPATPAIAVVYNSDFVGINTAIHPNITLVANAPSGSVTITYQAAVLSYATAHGVASAANTFWTYLQTSANRILGPLGYATI